jgi:hypothetical protein
MGIKVLRIAGIDVHVDWSLLVIFVLIAASLALAVFPGWHPDWGPGLSWATALLAALARRCKLFRRPAEIVTAPSAGSTNQEPSFARHAACGRRVCGSSSAFSPPSPFARTRR